MSQKGKRMFSFSCHLARHLVVAGEEDVLRLEYAWNILAWMRASVFSKRHWKQTYQKCCGTIATFHKCAASKMSIERLVRAIAGADMVSHNQGQWSRCPWYVDMSKTYGDPVKVSWTKLGRAHVAAVQNRLHSQKGERRYLDPEEIHIKTDLKTLALQRWTDHTRITHP